MPVITTVGALACKHTEVLFEENYNAYSSLHA